MGLRPNSHFTGGHISAVADLSEKISGRLMLGYQKRDLINKRTGGSLTEYYLTPDMVNAEVNHILE